MSDRSQTRPTAAAISMIAAMLVIGLIDNYVVVIAETVGLWQFLILRFVMAAPVIVLASWLGFGTLRPRNPKGVLVRSTFIATGMFCYFGALGFMPIAMALAGLFSSPIFVLLITAFILRQTVGPRRIVAVGLGFAGILVVLGPSVGALGWILALPTLGAVLYASGVVATRVLCEDESTLTLLFGIFVMQAVLGLCVLLGFTAAGITDATGDMAFLTRGWTWGIDAALPYLLIQVFGSVIGVSLLNRAYQLGEASRVTVFEYSVMIFGPLFGWILLGQPVTPVQILGIVMIATAGIIIALRSPQ